ncbi:MAG: hypothetical protein H7242_19510, partial [Microbacteriaceae bacterium]|nr:hypothetical protein [Burkholderiaceae bacterium]
MSERRNPYQLPAPAVPLLAFDGQSLPDRCCPLCHYPVAGGRRSDSRCPRCHSPLAAFPGPGRHAHEGLGRRGAVRRDQAHVAMVHVGWPAVAQPVRWRDLSLTGLSLYVAQALPVGSRLRLVDPALEVVV